VIPAIHRLERQEEARAIAEGARAEARRAEEALMLKVRMLLLLVLLVLLLVLLLVPLLVLLLLTCSPAQAPRRRGGAERAGSPLPRRAGTEGGILRPRRPLRLHSGRRQRRREQ